MGIATADTAGESGSPSPGAPGRAPPDGPGGPLGPTVALTALLALGACAVAIAAVLLAYDPPPLPPLLELGADHRGETALYVAAFALVTPAALVLVPRLAASIAAGPNGAGLSALVALLAGAFALCLLAALALPGRGLGGVLASVSAWWALTLTALARARREPGWPALHRAAARTRLAWTLAGGLATLALLAFASLPSLSPGALGLGAAAAAAALALRGRLAARGWGRWGAALDAAVVVALVVAVPDMVIFRPEAAGDRLEAYHSQVVALHHNYWLGPANEVLAGRPMLLGTASQYGVASLYAVAAWFAVSPIGYGTLGLLDGALFGLLFACGYLLLRVARVPGWLAAGGMAVGVIALVYNLAYAVGALPQHGPLRFGLPLALVLAAAAQARWPRRARAAGAVKLALLGLSSIWAVEAFAYSLLALAAITALDVAGRPPGARRARLRREAALFVAACAAAHLLLVGGTLAFAGEAPRYGEYLAILVAFLVGPVSRLTFDFSAWSPGLPVGALLLASAVATVLVARRRPDLVARERPAAAALAGTTAYGIGLYGYFVNRSLDEVLPYVSLPALLAAVLWLGLLVRGALTDSRPAQTGGLAFGLAVAVLLTSIAWSSVGERLGRSALAHALPGREPSLALAARRLWHLPPVDARAPRGEALLARHMPGRRRVAIVVQPELATEVLVRSGRANALPFTDARADSFVDAPSESAARRGVDELAPGQRVLLQPAGLDALALLRTRTAAEVYATPPARSARLTVGQLRVLKRMGERFRLRVVGRDRDFVVVELARR
jgi:hypothetical protein